MRLGFWITRFLLAAAAAFTALLAVELLKGHGLRAGASFAALWGAISAAIFTATRIYYVRKNIACAICNDIEGSCEVKGQSGK